jgi:hypothetical protein
VTEYIPYKDGSPVRFLGKCRRCKKLHKVEGVMEVEKHYPKMRGRLGAHRVEVWKGKWVLTVRCECRDGTVTNDHTLVQLDKVFSTGNVDHECSARCVNATGPACSCKCRGKNHGGK